MSGRILANGVADMANILAYAAAVIAGLGALVGSIITTRGRRHEAKATAADLLTEAAERVSRLNVRLDRENRELRKNLLKMVDCAEDRANGRVSNDVLLDCVREMREMYG